MTNSIRAYFLSALWGSVLPYLLLPLGLYFSGTFLSGNSPNLQLSDSLEFIIRLLKEEFLYYEPLAAAWLGWRVQNRRVAIYAGIFFSVLTLSQAVF